MQTSLSLSVSERLIPCCYVTFFGLVSGRKENKIAKAGVTVVKSESVNAPVIAEFPLTMECKVISINDELSETRVVGKVVNLQADENLFNEAGQLDYSLLRPISYDSETRSYRTMGGIIYKAFCDGSQLIK
ncbi:MAG: flavin reductase [Paraprevotella sp.]|nr:flavin reductase [Paraprevotella sp.]